jgi:hypothetical protein
MAEVTTQSRHPKEVPEICKPNTRKTRFMALLFVNLNQSGFRELGKMSLM